MTRARRMTSPGFFTLDAVSLASLARLRLLLSLVPIYTRNIPSIHNMQASASRQALLAARPAARRSLPRPQAYRRAYATVQEVSHSSPSNSSTIYPADSESLRSQSQMPAQAGTAGSHMASGLLGGGVVLAAL